MSEWCERQGVMELRLERAPLNEIGAPMLELLERFVEAAQRSTPRAVIVYSALPRGFCAGADLRALHANIAGQPYEQYQPELVRFMDRIHAVMNALDTLPCTTVGAIHGTCFGGGFELALTLDVLVADTTARFCFPELRLGLIPGFGGIPRLSRALPAPVARDLLLTGRSLGARRAGELGLVSQVVRKGDAVAVARDVAAQSARFAPDVVQKAKAFMKRIPEAELAEEKRLFLELFAHGRVERALAGFASSTEAMPYLPSGEA
jgi:enoyl-CoA hydratase/carnithine racemase